MTTAKHTIGEHDIVALHRPVDKDEVLTRDPGEDRGIGQWPAGTEGTVVSDYGKDKLIEISNDLGVALDFLTVPVQQLRLVTKHSNAGASIRPRRQKRRRPLRGTASPSSTS
jgi:Domain of unknown function (DUF4926)